MQTLPLACVSCPSVGSVLSCVRAEQEVTPETLLARENVPKEILAREEVGRL